MVWRMSKMFPELERDPRGGSLTGAERLCLFLLHCSCNNLQVIKMSPMLSGDIISIYHNLGFRK